MAPEETNLDAPQPEVAKGAKLASPMASAAVPGEDGEESLWPRSLLDGYRNGDAAAFLEIYRRYADSVASLLRWGFTFRGGGLTHVFVGYRGVAELQDAVQETFRRVFEPKTRLGYDGLRPFGPYVRTVARNHVIGAFRRQSAAFRVVAPPSAASDDAMLEVAALDGEESPESRLATEEARVLVAKFLGRLAPEDRRLLELRFIDGLSQRDVAEHMGIGRQRIRTREIKLRDELAAYLGEHGESAWVAEVLRCLPWLMASLLERAGEVWR
jgi:RNA polymerase sigma-70 factor (ECF subfamily)